jgi:hypothetical protein
VSFFSVGHGGRREEDGASAASIARRWRRGFLESAPFAAALKQRRRCAAATFGHRGGPAALGLSGPSFYFLFHWRISLNLGAAVSAAAPPSGFVPGGSRGGCVKRSTTVGGDDGPDRVLAISSRVLFVNRRDLCVFHFSFGVLAVICTPTAVMNSRL